MIIKKETKNASIIVAVLLIIMHSLLDFDMDFVSIMFTLFILISLLDSENKGICYFKKNKEENIENK